VGPTRADADPLAHPVDPVGEQDRQGDVDRHQVPVLEALLAVDGDVDEEVAERGVPAEGQDQADRDQQVPHPESLRCPA
jgi:hypothetical protein